MRARPVISHPHRIRGVEACCHFQAAGPRSPCHLDVDVALKVPQLAHQLREGPWVEVPSGTEMLPSTRNEVAPTGPRWWHCFDGLLSLGMIWMLMQPARETHLAPRLYYGRCSR